MNAGSVSDRGGGHPVLGGGRHRAAARRAVLELRTLTHLASIRERARRSPREDAVGRRGRAREVTGMTLTRLFPGDEEASSRARSGRRGGGDAWRRGFEPVATGREEIRKRVERTSPSSGRAWRVREWRAGRGVRGVFVFLLSRSVYDSRNAPMKKTIVYE